MKYIDRGWANMAALLDKEMPQTPRRRPGFLWWIAGAAGLILLAGWGYRSLLNPAEVAPAAEPVKHENSIAEQPAVASADEMPHDKLIGAGSSTYQVDGDQTGTDYSTLATSESAQPASPINGQVSVAHSVFHDEVQIEENVNAIEIANREELTTESVILLTSLPKSEVMVQKDIDDIGLLHETDLPAVPLERTALREHVEVAQLANHDLKSLEFYSEISPLAIAPDRHRYPLMLDGLVALHGSAAHGPLYGVEAGLSMGKPLARRVHLHAGLSYGYYNVDGIARSLIHADALSPELGMEPVPSSEELIGNSLDYGRARKLVESFHYLHLPVRLEYCISPRFSVMAGVRGSWLVSAHSGYPTDERSFGAIQVPGGHPKNFLVAYKILRRVDIAPLAAVSYQVSDRVKLDGAYTHGLSHYINNPENGDRIDFQRSLSVGVRYQLL